MVHYTCDMCGKPLMREEDVRYVVKIEVYTACDVIDIDDDIDEEVWDVEEEEEHDEKEEDAAEMVEDGEYKTFRFDLCTKCHTKYLQDPLFFNTWHRTRFSEN